MQPQQVRVGILGGSGYGGAELLRRLLQHPLVTLSGVASRQYLGRPLAAAWPHLAGVTEATFADEAEVIGGCEVLFTATPHGSTAPLVKQALEAGKRVIDLSADFRLSAEDYARWYGHPHPCPELLSTAVYGLTELHRDEIRMARLVANPGCNATAANLALAPLAAHGLLGEQALVSIAAAASGAGRSPELGLHYSEVNENVRPYKVAGTHRHIPEVEDTLGRAAALGRRLKTHAPAWRPTITFTPHLIPMTRGILASCATYPTRDGVTEAELLALYRAYYRDEPLIVVQDELPQTKAVFGSDRCLITVRRDLRSGWIHSFAVIDNLGKGAAGQAVHNLNVMLGFSETLALLGALWP
ncbi:MAG: N-acetyl-gamma-glutamyl-phosphate reductase [Truepera sp.]|nr:N-acetyl-gamma-glutamyl-phosphate reductase [Truepera sp.]